jgi:hypothetical protein
MITHTQPGFPNSNGGYPWPVGNFPISRYLQEHNMLLYFFQFLFFFQFYLAMIMKHHMHSWIDKFSPEGSGEKMSITHWVLQDSTSMCIGGKIFICLRSSHSSQYFLWKILIKF